MNGAERARITLILRHEVDLARRAYTEGRTEIYQNHAAAGRLRSGSTVKALIAAIRETLLSQVSSLDGKIRAIVSDRDAFAMLTVAIEDLLGVFIGELSDYVRVATGGKNEASVERAAAELFAQAESDTRAELAILEFEYGEQPRRTETVPAVRSQANKGGKPLAAHWDEMWAAIAFQLWNGDLKPTKQADITKAMFAWLNANEIDAGQTAVTDRARAIWRKIEASD